jgi:hypothetical protein
MNNEYLRMTCIVTAGSAGAKLNLRGGQVPVCEFPFTLISTTKESTLDEQNARLRKASRDRPRWSDEPTPIVLQG